MPRRGDGTAGGRPAGFPSHRNPGSATHDGPGDSLHHRSRFVGRRREFAALVDALARPPAVVLVEGEAGIGKSRLLQEYQGSPTAAGHRGLYAACPPFRRPYTLGPVVDALRQRTGDVAGLGLSPLAGGLRTLFPEWAHWLPAALEPVEDATASRHRVFRALAELLDRLGVALLVVEDVHWADEVTLEFLLFLVARGQPGPSLLLTYRPEDVPEGSLLLRLSSRPPAGRTHVRITLESLDIAETAQMVSSMLEGEHVSDSFARFVFQHTEGLPLAVEESVRLMQDRADIFRRDGQWMRRHLDAIEVPPTLRDAVLERVRHLDRAAQAVLRAAAVLADPCDAATVGAVAGQADQAGPADAVVRDAEGWDPGIAAALASGLLTVDGQGLLSFRHTLTCRAVYELIPAPERRLLHRRAGAALEGVSPAPVVRLARHYREAADMSRWCRYGEQAVDLALASGDEASAFAVLDDLFTHAEMPPETLLRLARKLSLSTFPGITALARPARRLREVLDAGGIDPGPAAELRVQLGRALMSMEDFEAGVREISRAIPHLSYAPAEALRAMTLLGWPRGSPWPAAEHLHWLRRAAALSRSVDVDLRLNSEVRLATASLMLGDPEGWAMAARLGDAPPARRHGHQYALAHLNFGDMAMRWGRLAEAGRRLDLALDLADRYAGPGMRMAVLVTRTHLDWYTGAWDRAGHAAGLIDGQAQHSLRREGMLVAALLRLAAGADPGAADDLAGVLDAMLAQRTADYAVEPAAALAFLALDEDRVSDALRLTEELIGTVAGKDVWIWATDLAPARVAALLAAGRAEDAAHLVTAFAKGLRGRDAPAPDTGLKLCRAMLVEARGEPVQAAVRYARVARAWRDMPRPYDALLAQRRQAHCLLAAGRDEEGITLLARTRDELVSLGARRAATAVGRTLSGYGVADPNRRRGGRPSYGDRLSPRELEVVRLLVGGRSNRQIAEALVLSVPTVAGHVHSAMRKLSAPSRTALAVTAVELGLVPAGRESR